MLCVCPGLAPVTDSLVTAEGPCGYVAQDVVRRPYASNTFQSVCMCSECQGAQGGGPKGSIVFRRALRLVTGSGAARVCLWCCIGGSLCRGRRRAHVAAASVPCCAVHVTVPTAGAQCFVARGLQARPLPLAQLPLPLI